MPNEIITPKEAARRLADLAKRLIDEMKEAGASDQEITEALSLLFGHLAHSHPSHG